MARDLAPAIIHVDLDAFFAAVEILDDPSLAGRPVVVGGTGGRGVVAACSYEARVFGVHSAMPTARARRLCPHAVYLSGRFDRYQEISAAFGELLGRYTPLVEPVSMDEAFLDVAGSVRLFGSPPEIAARLRREVATELGLSASAGVAPTKMLAKLASEAAKPQIDPARPGAGVPQVRPGAGVVVVCAGGELEFLHPLPVRALWGVGPATARRLEALGVSTVGDLAQIPVQALAVTLGRAAANTLHQLASGRDSRGVEPHRPVRSIGHERTFATDRSDRPGLEVELLRLADGVARRLRDSGMAARTVSLKVRFGDFRTISRAHTPGRPIVEPMALSRCARSLLDEVDLGPGVRLLGLSARNLVPPSAERVGGPAQLELGQPELVQSDRASASDSEGWADVAEALDRVRARFGESAVAPGALVGADGLEIFRKGQRRWGPSE